MKKTIIAPFIFFLLPTVAIAQQTTDNVVVVVTQEADTLPCQNDTYHVRIKGGKEAHVRGSNSNESSESAKKTMEDIQAQRVAFITQKMELTPDEAQIFFPIYNQLTEKRNQLNKAKRQLTAKIDAEMLSKLSDSDADKLLNQLMELEVKQAAQEVEYAKKMKAAVSSKKLLLLQKSESEFMRTLLIDIRKGKWDSDR